MQRSITLAAACAGIALATVSAGCQTDSVSQPVVRSSNTIEPSTPHTASGVTPVDVTTLQPNERGSVYFYTKAQKVFCAVDESSVSCQAKFTNTPLQDGVRTNGVRFTRDGAVDYVIGDADVRPELTLDYTTYRAFGWTIVAADDDSVAFRYNATDHGIYVSIDKVTPY